MNKNEKNKNQKTLQPLKGKQSLSWKGTAAFQYVTDRKSPGLEICHEKKRMACLLTRGFWEI